MNDVEYEKALAEAIHKKVNAGKRSSALKKIKLGKGAVADISDSALDCLDKLYDYQKFKHDIDGKSEHLSIIEYLVWSRVGVSAFKAISNIAFDLSLYNIAGRADAAGPDLMESDYLTQPGFFDADEQKYQRYKNVKSSLEALGKPDGSRESGEKVGDNDYDGDESDNGAGGD